MGELHLDIIVDRMKREFKVEANVGAPQVAYRETIQSLAEFDSLPLAANVCCIWKKFVLPVRP